MHRASCYLLPHSVVGIHRVRPWYTHISSALPLLPSRYVQCACSQSRNAVRTTRGCAACIYCCGQRGCALSRPTCERSSCERPRRGGGRAARILPCVKAASGRTTVGGRLTVAKDEEKTSLEGSWRVKPEGRCDCGALCYSHRPYRRDRRVCRGDGATGSSRCDGAPRGSSQRSSSMSTTTVHSGVGGLSRSAPSPKPASPAVRRRQ